MEIKAIQEPKYQLTLTADEMSKLADIMYDAKSKGVKEAFMFFDKLEGIRPADGFKEAKAEINNDESFLTTNQRIEVANMIKSNEHISKCLKLKK